MPNGPLSTGNIVNYSVEAVRRVDLTFGIGYDDDLKLAKKTLCDLVEADSRVLKDRDYTVAVSELADSSVNFVVRVFVNSADYWNVYFDTLEKVKLTFDEKGISILVLGWHLSWLVHSHKAHLHVSSRLYQPKHCHLRGIIRH